MAAPAFRSRTQVSGTASSQTVGEPAGATTDDIIVAVAYIESNSATFTPPSGWTSVFTASAVGVDSGILTTPDIFEAHAYWIRRLSSAPSYTFAFGTTAFCEVTAYAYSGAYNSGDPFSFASVAVRDSVAFNTPIPNISGTTDTADELLLFYGCTFAGGTLTGPTGFTTRATTGYDVQTADTAQASAGATGTVTGAQVGSYNGNAAGFLIGLRSLAAPGGGGFAPLNTLYTGTPGSPFYTGRR